jgi:hypothetical protein
VQHPLVALPRPPGLIEIEVVAPNEAAEVADAILDPDPAEGAVADAGEASHTAPATTVTSRVPQDSARLAPRIR